MTTERLLTDVVMLESWGQNVADMFNHQQDMRQEILVRGYMTADMVMFGALGLRELKQGTDAYAGLDRQAVAIAGGDIDELANTADFLEATARRFAHHTGNVALGLVGSAYLRRKYAQKRQSLDGTYRALWETK